MEAPRQFLAIDGILVIAVAWFAIGLCGIAALHRVRFVGRVLFPLSAVLSVALAGFALLALPGAPQTAVLAIGLPDLPFHLRLDALSAFFLALLGLAPAATSGRARARRRGCCACTTTSSWPPWRW
jgi:hydrogenase-4 component B